jgi:hypothetical protein
MIVSYNELMSYQVVLNTMLPFTPLCFTIQNSPIWVQFRKEWPLKIDPIIVKIVYQSRPRLMSNYITYPNCNKFCCFFFSAKWKKKESYNIIKLDDLSCFKKIHLWHTWIQVQSIRKHNHFFFGISKHKKWDTITTLYG